MLIYGQQEIFADHVVYKSPHNYQVILKLHFDEDTLFAYQHSRDEFPARQIYLILDPMNIAEIKTAPILSGKLIQEIDNGNPKIIKENVSIPSGEFSVLYLEALPFTENSIQIAEPPCPRHPPVKCY